MEEQLQPAVRPIEIVDECLVINICIDEYLWALYERTPKVDTNKVTKQIKTTVKTKKGKTRTVTKTITDYVVADFAWKDPIAAQKAGMSVKDYVIGGMDRGFKLKLFRALRTMDDAGFMPGITSAFRDDYRQSIASGNKAASDSSFHGGSRRGGYGHGLAIDHCERQRADPSAAIRRERAAVEVDRYARDGAWRRPALSRSRPSTSRADRWQGICRQARANDRAKDRIVNKQGTSGEIESKRQALRRVAQRVCCRSGQGV